MHGQHGIPEHGVLESLFIDDYYVLDLGREKSGLAEKKFVAVQAAYTAEKLYGSPIRT